MKTVQLSPLDLLHIHEIFTSAKSVRIFGSRAKLQAQKFSDIDICICDSSVPSGAQMEIWREACDESNLPYTVDLSRISDLPDFMQQLVTNEGVLLAEAEPLCS